MHSGYPEYCYKPLTSGNAGWRPLFCPLGYLHSATLASNLRLIPPPNPLLSRPLSEADEAVLRAFARRLASVGKSERTIQSYVEAARLLAGFLDGRATLEEARSSDIEDFMIYLISDEQPDHSISAVQKPAAVLRLAGPRGVDRYATRWLDCGHPSQLRNLCRFCLMTTCGH